MRRVLVCAPRIPEFDREGGSQRLFHLIEFLQEDGWTVSYLARDGSDSQNYCKILRQRGVVTYLGSESTWVGDEYLEDAQELLSTGRFDLIILAFWYVAEQYLPAIRKFSPDTRVVTDSIDLHFLRGARSALRRTSMNGDTPKLDVQYATEMMRELNAYAASDIVLTVSQKEADLVNDFANDPSLAHTVPLMEDLAPSDLARDRRSGILFIGNFRHPPNVEAVEYLCGEILPRIDSAVLKAHPVLIVGNGLDDRIAARVRGSGDIRLVGWVPSVLPYLHTALVAVAPLLSGAGTKTKLVQALTVGTPAVSTPIGIEGLELRRDQDILVADDPAEFADRVTRLIEDADLWCKLAENGRAQITAVHGRDAVRARFSGAISAALAKVPKRHASTSDA